MPGLRKRWAVSAVLIGVGLIALTPRAAAAAATHRCPSHAYWTNIVVRGMTCEQAVQLHREKLRDCTHPTRRRERHEFVYTCLFGPWRSIETVRAVPFADRIHIARDDGRIWMRYDALP
jgi:hypothetical protein